MAPIRSVAGATARAGARRAGGCFAAPRFGDPAPFAVRRTLAARPPFAFPWRLRVLASGNLVLPPPRFGIDREPLRVLRVDDVLRREPALARDPHAEVHVREAREAVRVGADGDRDAGIPGPAAQAPVEVEALRVGVDLDRAAQLGGAREDPLHVDRVRVAGEEEPPRRVPEDGEV